MDTDVTPPIVGADYWSPVLRAVGFVEPDRWAVLLAAPAARWDITPGKRAAAWSTTLAHESASGTRLEENLRYSAKRLTQVWPSRFPSLAAAAPYAWDPSDPDAEDVALANLVYGSRMGNEANGTADNDGWVYRGRGLIQLTGLDAYRRAAVALGYPLVEDPDLATDPAVAAEIAAWTWAAWKACNLLADNGYIEGWRRAINGGLNGIDDVRARYVRALAVA